ncbi:hypothetical protein [Stieleria varia]|uniref:Secreted protein n=1 Tax=Stieleria varia TaxID=2528005 RepID=A0A5C6B8H4_9BACT|nr:hypothetical protein [Stieleria varia]TWU08067.1 hypothetical protein Pla52n_06480 [Stieleria varia]
MKKLTFASVVMFCFMAVSSVGCGDSKPVVNKPPENAVPTSELPSQKGYEDAMKAQGKQGPGN